MILVLSFGKQKVSSMSYIKLIKDSLGNMSIFPEKKLAIDLSTFVWYTAKEFTLAGALQSKLIMIFVCR